MKPSAALAALVLLATPLAVTAQVPVTVATDQQALLRDNDPEEARNKRLVYDFWREVFVAGDMSKLDQYMHPDYIQHNPAVATGREAFRAFFGGRAARPVQPTIDNLVSIVGDGDMVVMAFRREMTNPATGAPYTTTWFDMFRIIDGKIGEHWDYGTLGGAPGRAGAAPASPGRAGAAGPGRGPGAPGN